MINFNCYFSERLFKPFNMQYCLADIAILRSDVSKEGTTFKHLGQNYFQLDETLNVKALLKGWFMKIMLVDIL